MRQAVRGVRVDRTNGLLVLCAVLSVVAFCEEAGYTDAEVLCAQEDW